MLRRSCWLVLLLPVLGCARYKYPDFAFGDPGYVISAGARVNGKIPEPRSTFYVEDRYNTWFWGLWDGREFHMEPCLKAKMGDCRVLTRVKIKTYFRWWQVITNVCTLFIYEGRTVEITGQLSPEIPK